MASALLAAASQSQFPLQPPVLQVASHTCVPGAVPYAARFTQRAGANAMTMVWLGSAVNACEGVPAHGAMTRGVVVVGSTGHTGEVRHSPWVADDREVPVSVHACDGLPLHVLPFMSLAAARARSKRTAWKVFMVGGVITG